MKNIWLKQNQVKRKLLVDYKQGSTANLNYFDNGLSSHIHIHNLFVNGWLRKRQCMNVFMCQ